MPFALCRAIEDELDRLERDGIVEKVMHSEWVTPIVAVPKPDSQVRLCRDFYGHGKSSTFCGPVPTTKR